MIRLGGPASNLPIAIPNNAGISNIQQFMCLQGLSHAVALRLGSYLITSGTGTHFTPFSRGFLRFSSRGIDNFTDSSERKYNALEFYEFHGCETRRGNWIYLELEAALCNQKWNN